MNIEMPVSPDDNPEWTDADFAKARPASELVSAAVVDALVRSKGGRPRGETKELVSLRIDKDVLARFRAPGPGWQSRINAALRKAV